MKNLSLELAEFCSSVEVGAPSVFTWMVYRILLVEAA
jgi:hypothetical protein